MPGFNIVTHHTPSIHKYQNSHYYNKHLGHSIISGVSASSGSDAIIRICSSKDVITLITLMVYKIYWCKVNISPLFLA